MGVSSGVYRTGCTGGRREREKEEGLDSQEKENRKREMGMRHFRTEVLLED